MSDIIYMIKHAEEEGPGLLGDCLKELGRETVEVELHKGYGFPVDLHSAVGIVSLGGPMNVYEEEKYPFLKEEDGFIKAVLAADIPFLGICLGSQLLAKAKGAEVTKAPLAEVGWSRVSLTAAGRSDELLRGLPDEMPVFQWHEDTFGLPEGSLLLATSETCANQAFMVSGTAYGLQFHLEAGPDVVKGWTEKEPSLKRLMKMHGGKAISRRVARKHCMVLAKNFVRIIDSARRIRKVMDLYVEKPQARSTELWWSVEKRTLLQR